MQALKTAARRVQAICFYLALITLAPVAHAQLAPTHPVYQQIKAADSLLFDVGFNTCNMSVFSQVIGTGLEFYHDQGGLTSGKEAFVASIRDGLCRMDYKAQRRLMPSSMQVYPLYKNGELYGAWQEARHLFYAQRPGKPDELTSIARFSHLWQLQQGQWQLVRAVSFDHLTPQQAGITEAQAAQALAQPSARQ